MKLWYEDAAEQWEIYLTNPFWTRIATEGRGRGVRESVLPWPASAYRRSKGKFHLTGESLLYQGWQQR